MTITAAEHTNAVPLPAGVTHVDEWHYVGISDTVRTRLFYGTRRGELARVDLVGTQDGDGQIIERLIKVDYKGARSGSTAPPVARELVADLLAAADD
jgi:hypothetical protein